MSAERSSSCQCIVDYEDGLVRIWKNDVHKTLIEEGPRYIFKWFRQGQERHKYMLFRLKKWGYLSKRY